MTNVSHCFKLDRIDILLPSISVRSLWFSVTRSYCLFNSPSIIPSGSWRISSGSNSREAQYLDLTNVAIRGLVHLLNCIFYPAVNSFSDTIAETRGQRIPDSPALESIKYFVRNFLVDAILKELHLDTSISFIMHTPRFKKATRWVWDDNS